MKRETKQITLSVVVIGRNEGERLEACLDAIQKMQYSKGRHEIIYVDSMSVDDSVSQAEVRGIPVISIQESRLTAALARNAGWRASKGELILFLDADTVVDSEFVSKAMTEFENPDVGVVTGRLSERFPTDTLYNRVFDLDWDLSSRDYCGGNALIRRGALEKVGGYNTALIAGEEPEMCQRLKAEGYQVLHVDIPMGLHDIGMKSFKQYWRRCFRNGYTYAFVSGLSSGALWRREVRHNLIKGSLMTFGFVVVCAAALFGGTFLPLIVYLSLFSLLVLRTTLQVKGARSRTTAFLYALHSHFQHVPMFFGQLAYWKDRLFSKTRGIIEYK